MRAVSDKPHDACPPVLEYSRAEQARVAEEIKALPENAVIIGWLANYAVLRAQARVCGGGLDQPVDTSLNYALPSRLLSL